MAVSEPKILSEEETRNLESMIPELASGATYSAYVRALASGQSVVRVDGEQIIAKSADGSIRVVGQAKPRRKVKAGLAFHIGAADHVGT